MTHNVKQVLQTANDALYLMGGKYENRFALAAQLVQEKGWEWWENPQPPYNVGNVTNGGVEHGFAEYSTLEDGMKGFAHVYLATSFDGGEHLVYQNVLDEARHGDNESLLHAICNSPFCAPPYDYNTLESIMNTIKSIYDEEHNQTPTPVTTPEKMYTVQPGDTLWSIALKEYGNGFQWSHIASLNPGIQPKLLHIGQTIRIQ